MRSRTASWCLLATLSGCLAWSCGGTPAGETSQGPGELVQLPDMLARRFAHTATALPTGVVLLTGGGSPGAVLRSAELYDPAHGDSKQVSPLGTAREGHAAALLADGRVLLVGGLGPDPAVATSAELWNPVSESFSPAPALLAPHGDGVAVVPLLDGRLLVLGGDTSGVGRTPTAAAELFDPGSGAFTPTGAMHVPRLPFGVVRLRDGRVLVAGGTTTNKVVVASAELYDPATGTFTLTGQLGTARRKHAGVLLADGRVLIVGGTTGGDDSNVLTSGEIFDPATGQFTSAAHLVRGRYKFQAVALPDGSVFATGGADALAEVIDPVTGLSRVIAGAGSALRFFPAATLLADGSVLVSGGYSGQGPQATVWRFRP